jgi:hypothetical protein
MCKKLRGERMNKKNRLTVSVVGAIIILACACPATGLPATSDPATATLPAISTQPEIPTDPPVISDSLLSDDFSVDSGELEIFSDDSGSAEIKDGAYVVRSTGEKWNWGRSDSEFSDTVIEFDLTITVAPSNNNAGAGVICRMQARDDNSIDGYLLAISSDGYYSIRSITASSMEPLVDWTSSGVIHQGNELNKIRATCNGSELILEVNGEALGIATAAGGETSGGFAFAAVSFETAEPVAEAHFDNLVISQP